MAKLCIAALYLIALVVDQLMLPRGHIYRIQLHELSRGSTHELQRLCAALRGPGFFAATGKLSDSVVLEAYAASCKLHSRADACNWAKTKCPPKGRPTRWWFNAQRGHPWPEDEPGSTAAIRAMDSSMDRAAAILASATSEVLGIDPASLGASPDSDHCTNMRVLRYAPVSHRQDELGISAHVDFGDFTLCHSNGEGLQILDRTVDTWHDAAGAELIFIAATGLQRKSRGAVKAVSHRVQPSKAERFSFCRFHGVERIRKDFGASVY